ncbi:MAG: GNAT family N-acetyltransferase [Spirochaetales bacterium]|jgi:diamine N-acetyltransferase|nr:GNAT family N-acetyltransferase [Spirochaetales bacterium]
MSKKAVQLVSLEEITEDSLSEILNMDVAEEQKRYITSNAKSIAQAHFSNYSWFRAIYNEKIPVGFIMLYLDPDKPIYEIWRFMIDSRYQRKGYGSAALGHCIDFVRSLPYAQELLASVLPENGAASSFFIKHNFFFTGEWHGNEKIMKMEF